MWDTHLTNNVYVLRKKDRKDGHFEASQYVLHAHVKSVFSIVVAFVVVV
jgi:hypothetical protein